MLEKKNKNGFSFPFPRLMMDSNITTTSGTHNLLFPYHKQHLISIHVSELNELRKGFHFKHKIKYSDYLRPTNY